MIVQHTKAVHKTQQKTYFFPSIEDDSINFSNYARTRHKIEIQGLALVHKRSSVNGHVHHCFIMVPTGFIKVLNFLRNCLDCFQETVFIYDGFFHFRIPQIKLSKVLLKALNYFLKSKNLNKYLSWRTKNKLKNAKLQENYEYNTYKHYSNNCRVKLYTIWVSENFWTWLT